MTGYGQQNIVNQQPRHSFFLWPLVLALFVFTFLIPAHAQSKYENRRITDIDIAFDGKDQDVSAAEQFKLIAGSALGDRYATVRVRKALDELNDSKKIVWAEVQAFPVGESGVRLRFVIKRKTQAESVNFKIGTSNGDPVTENDLLLKVNVLNPGTSVTEQLLSSNADAIQAYLRERGYYSADVSYSQQELESQARVAVTFQVNPNAQSRVESFNIDIKGADQAALRAGLRLQSGGVYSHAALEEDIDKIRKALIGQGYLAPRLNEPVIKFDPDKNTISISLAGETSAKATVKVNVENQKIGDKTQQRLLPIKRDGTLDFSAIREGSRRLRNYYQEKGYFFVEIEELCSVTPEFAKDPYNPLENNTNDLCAALSGADLNNKNVEVNYNVNLNRRFKLTDIRIEGTKTITVPDIITALDTQHASILGKIPRLGYGRGYTSTEILDDDAKRLESIMRQLGYRNSRVRVKQGATPDGENLIITFVVAEGIPTRIAEVEIIGNKIFATDTLRTKLPDLVEKNYSRARARNGEQKLAEFYTGEGYFDVKVDFAVVELPKKEGDLEERVKLVYTVIREGKKVLINRVLLNGNRLTKRKSILKAITLKPGEILKQTDIFASEQNLYASDAFYNLEIKAEAAGETRSGEKQMDVVVNLQEQKPRIISYGGGYSTDLGWSGFLDFRHVNLWGRLQQGGARIRWSARQQLVQFDFIDPRFLKDGKNRYTPLTVTLQYQRDSTVTRFFRSAFDRGTFGIVQRIDANGKPIDQFGGQVADPAINRLSLTVETNRTIDRKARSLLFFRYRFEDVRLSNVDSLLIADILRPDERVRISGFGTTFVRDTRQNCSRTSTLLEIVTRGEALDPCRYNQSDPTKGLFLSAEYNLSARQLGANIGFHKFQANFQTYYQIPKLNNTVLAGRAVVGLASVFSKSRMFNTPPFDQLNDILPISERFFAGGSTTLRGFDFDSAGPRVVVVPQGTFRDSKGNIVTLDPFTIPFGGNALAITNLEARIPLTKTVQAVPFYDGGNVFTRINDLFNPSNAPPGDVFKANLRQVWTHTIGFGLRIKTPLGGSLAIDYGYLVNPPQFIIPQIIPPDAIYVLKHGQLHFRFAQTF